MSSARSHASTSTSIALTFALMYNLFYIPSEFNSLDSFKELYVYLNNASHLDHAGISYGAFAGGIGDEWRNPNTINSAIYFYYFRIISRLFLILFMSCCIAAFVSCRISIPDDVFRHYFQEYMFKELRSLHRSNAHVGPLLMRRLINVDPLSSFSPMARNRLQSEATFSFLGSEFRISVVLPYVVNFLNPVFFVFFVIPSRIMRFLMPNSQPNPSSFIDLQRACFQIILYHDSLRRTMKRDFLFKDFICFLISTCIFPRRLIVLYCSPETVEVLDEIDAIFRKFPVQQRVQFIHAIVCHSNGCLFTVGLLYLLLFLQNALSSELVVSYWFSIPSSQKKVSVNDTKYELFHNYRELVNWEYFINDHFLFLIFFAVNLTCTNSTMFLVLAPTFFVTAAGLYSNHNTTIDLGSIDSWFIISLFIAYLLSFITNSLTYRDVCEMFFNRASDYAFVSDNTMLELSHEFMSLSCISLEAMEDCCNIAASSDVDLIRCMMWLLRKQRLHVHMFQPTSRHALKTAMHAPVSRVVSIRKILSEEFKAGDASSVHLGDVGVLFASACNVCKCNVEFKYEFSTNTDLTVCCVESEIRHFFCAFLSSILSNSSNWSGSLKICVRVQLCRAYELHEMLTRPFHSTLSVGEKEGPVSIQSKSVVRAHSLHRVNPLPVQDPDKQFVQFVAEILEILPNTVESSSEDVSRIQSLFELDHFAVLEFVTRMQGSIRISIKGGLEFDHILGACALPCDSIAVMSSQESRAPLSLRFLIIEDNAMFAKALIAKMKGSPMASNYFIHHEKNVADALLKFSNGLETPVDHALGFASNRTFDVVLIDQFMPMEAGADIDSQAGVLVLI